MPHFSPILSVCFSLTFVGAACAQNSLPEVTTSLPLQQIVVGEEAILNVQAAVPSTTGPLTATKKSPLVFRGLPADSINGRRIFAANVGVTTDTPGVYEVPAFKVPLPGGTALTESQTIEAFPTDEIEWQTLQSDSASYKIGSLLLFPSGDIYAGQSIPITAKIFLPTTLPLSSTGYAEIEKENIGAWRMGPPVPPNYNQQVSPRPANALRPREVRIDGERYQVVNYVTFANPLKPGKVTVGPANIEGLQVIIESQQQRRGFFGSFRRSANLDYEIPAVSFEAKKLPAGAPANFSGAIGDFTLETAFDVTTETQAGEPIRLELTLTGTGNFDALAAPEMVGEKNSWKVYPATKDASNSERKSNRGSVTFTQILRPTATVKEIPSFVFSFFNPTSKKYEVLRSEPIPLDLVAAAGGSGNAPPEAGLVPIAEMSDILSIIPVAEFKASSRFSPGYWWQLIPAAIAVFFVVKIVRRKFPHLGKRDETKSAYQAQLNALEETKGTTEFIRSAAHFAEANDLEKDDFVSELLAERDRDCFQPGGPQTEISQSRRREILTELRRRVSQVSLLLFACIVSFSSRAEADSEVPEARQAWKSGDFGMALERYQKALSVEESPDLYYNIGNCYYRLNQPARAALAYHRALRLQPSHPEARQNLAFINRKLGAIPTLREEPPAWSKRFPRKIVQFVSITALWLAVLAILARFALSASTLRRFSFPFALSAIFVALLATVFLIFIPSGTEEAEPADALVVTAKPAEVRTEASTAGSVILNASPATTCDIVRERGNWAYIELPEGTRGWISSEALEKI